MLSCKVSAVSPVGQTTSPGPHLSSTVSPPPQTELFFVLVVYDGVGVGTALGHSGQARFLHRAKLFLRRCVVFSRTV